jgi:hypothetical protein
MLLLTKLIESYRRIVPKIKDIYVSLESAKDSLQKKSKKIWFRHKR